MLLPGLTTEACTVKSAEYVVIPNVVAGSLSVGVSGGGCRRSGDRSRTGASGGGGGCGAGDGGGSSAGSGGGGGSSAVAGSGTSSSVRQRWGHKLVRFDGDAIKGKDPLRHWLANDWIPSAQWPDFLVEVLRGMRSAPKTLLIGQPSTRNSNSPDLLFGVRNSLWLLQMKALQNRITFAVVAEAVVNAQLQAVAGKLPPGAMVNMVVLGLHGAGPEMTEWTTRRGHVCAQRAVCVSKCACVCLTPRDCHQCTTW
jgi:hypothetical protein